MKIGTVMSSALSQCWRPYLAVSDCVGCSAYKTCTLECRRWDATLDEMLLQERELQQQLRALRKRISNYEIGDGDE